MVIGDSELWGLYAALAAAGVSTMGLLLMAFVGDWGHRNSAYFSAFAVGFLLVAVFLHLVPEAISYSPDAWRWIIGGLLGMTLIGAVLRISSSQRADGGDRAFGYASVIVLGAHSILDGVIYVTTFQDEPFTGALSTFALLLHEFPEGVIAFVLLREAGVLRFRAAILAFFVASVTTIGGALVTALVIEHIQNVPLTAPLGLTAGGLIYIIFLHLAPHASLTPHRRGYLAAGIGAAIALAAVTFREIAGH